MRTLIKEANCVLPHGVEKTSVLLEDGKIAAIGDDLPQEVDEIVEAGGLYLLPGVIDDQVHFREPGLTHKEDIHTGSRACAAGGVTSFLEMPNTKPNTVTVEALHQKLDLAAEKSLVNYGFYIGATPENLDELKKADRTPGIKIFIGSSTGDLLVDNQKALEEIFAETDLPICAHCEDESVIYHNTIRYSPLERVEQHSLVRDNLAAVVATRRATALAIKYNHRFHVLHLSAQEELEVVKDHRGLITAEVCPHHLFFNTENYEELGSLVQMNPSLKSPYDNAELWRGLEEGLIQVIASDHAPHTLEEKEAPYPNSPSGLPSVELILPLMLNAVNIGKCSIEQVARWMSTNPAKVWDIENKGVIKEGFDADLVLVDLNKARTVRNADVQTKAGWSPWHGETLVGWPVRTFVHGATVFNYGELDDSVRGREITYDRSRGGFWQNQ